MQLKVFAVGVVLLGSLAGCTQLPGSREDIQPDVDGDVLEIESVPDNFDRFQALEKEIVAHLNALEAELDKEPADPIWSAAAKGHLAGLRQQSTLGGWRTDRVRCAANLCELRVAHESPESVMEYAKFAQTDQAAPWNPRNAFGSALVEGKKMLSVLYVARPGKALPLALPGALAAHPSVEHR